VQDWLNWDGTRDEGIEPSLLSSDLIVFSARYPSSFALKSERKHTGCLLPGKRNPGDRKESQREIGEREQELVFY
jgi:hypothetical protein